MDTSRVRLADRMEQRIRDYFDACNSGDADAVAAHFTPDAVHYFPPGMYGGPFRGAAAIGQRWAWAVATNGSNWSVDEVICDPDTHRAVIEWTHAKPGAGVVLRGDEWYRFDADTGLISEIRAYYASPQATGMERLELEGFPYGERGYREGLPHTASTVGAADAVRTGGVADAAGAVHPARGG